MAGRASVLALGLGVACSAESNGTALPRTISSRLVGAPSCSSSGLGPDEVALSTARLRLPRWSRVRGQRVCLQALEVGPWGGGLRFIAGVQLTIEGREALGLAPGQLSFGHEGEVAALGILAWDAEDRALNLLPTVTRAGESSTLVDEPGDYLLIQAETGQEFLGLIPPPEGSSWSEFASSAERATPLEAAIDADNLLQTVKGELSYRDFSEALRATLLDRTRPRCAIGGTATDHVSLVEGLLARASLLGVPLDRPIGAHCTRVEVRDVELSPSMTGTAQTLVARFGAYDSDWSAMDLDVKLEVESEAPLLERDDVALPNGEQELRLSFDVDGRDAFTVALHATSPELATGGFFEDVALRSSLRASQAWTFDDGPNLDDWKREYRRRSPGNRVGWAPDLGRPGGALLMQGWNDEPTPDWAMTAVSRQLVVSESATRLSFDARAVGRGRTRVYLYFAEGGEEVPINWVQLSTEAWARLELDLTPYRGREMTLMIEGGSTTDDTPDQKATVLIDNVQIFEATR